MLNYTVDNFPVKHRRYENLTKIIISVEEDLSEEDIGIFIKRYNKFIVIAIDISKTYQSGEYIQNWILNEYHSLFDFKKDYDNIGTLTYQDYPNYRLKKF